MTGTAKRFLGKRPKLAGFVRMRFDEVRDRWVLQAPERVLVLDETSKEILDLCDGAATSMVIVSRLASEYDAPAEVIEHDVLAVLELLDEKKLIEWGGSDEDDDGKSGQ